MVYVKVTNQKELKFSSSVGKFYSDEELAEWAKVLVGDDGGKGLTLQRLLAIF